jgi:hypothetical protein
MEDLDVIVNRDFILQKGNIKIPKQLISRITIKFGYLSKCPIFQLMLGIILSILGLLPLYHFFLVEMYGGTFYFKEALATPFFIIGCYLVISCLRKGYFVEIKTDFGNQRIVFDKNAEKSRIDNLLKYARNLDYPIFSEID